jgi:hypothetical protein
VGNGGIVGNVGSTVGNGGIVGNVGLTVGSGSMVGEVGSRVGNGGIVGNVGLPVGNGGVVGDVPPVPDCFAMQLKPYVCVCRVVAIKSGVFHRKQPTVETEKPPQLELAVHLSSHCCGSGLSTTVNGGVHSRTE